MARLKWVTFTGGSDVAGFSGKPEDAVAISVEGNGDAPALDQLLHQVEVAPGVLLLAKHRVGHGAGGIVHRQEQGELRALLTQPPMKTAVDLHQHAFLGHSLPSHPVSGRPTFPRAGNARPGQDAVHCSPAGVNPLPVTQQLGEVGLIGSPVGGAGQLHHRSCLGVGEGVAGPTAAVPVGQCVGALLAIGRQQAPG